MVEVESLVDLVRAAADDTPHLILLDELFRGTNAIEPIAAGQAVLRELVTGGGQSRHIVLAATHDGELVDLLPDAFIPVHFGDTVTDPEARASRSHRATGLPWRATRLGDIGSLQSLTRMDPRAIIGRVAIICIARRPVHASSPRAQRPQRTAATSEWRVRRA
jgi:hypothetical protein